jgi:esterase
MKLHYQTLGQGQPLILLHGLFGSSNNWGTVAKHFSQSHQVISVDLRNHGKSPHADSQNYPDMANDLIELCDSLNLESIDLLGHSLGGKVAMQFATQYPDRMNQLIVVDIAMRTYPDAQTYLIDAMLALDLATIQTRSEADQALSSTITNATVRQFLLMNLVKADDVKSSGNLQWRINLPALKVNYPLIRQAVCTSTQFNKPSLFIRGEHSDYIRDDDVAQIKSHFINAQFASLPAGHWVHAEQPQTFAELVTKFLST